MKKKITKDKWIWMPHPAHFICSRDCQFFLATKVGKYIISTVGEYFPDSRVRQIFADSRRKSIKGMGDEYDRNYLKEIGYEDLHYDGYKYETMVFKSKKRESKGPTCCPYQIIASKSVDEVWHKTPEEAYKSHLVMCLKWSKK